MKTQAREFSIYFHASLVSAKDRGLLHLAARLAHYYRFHYHCRTFLWNPDRTELPRWDRQVVQPIPYPQIPMVDRIEGGAPRIIFSALEGEDIASRWLSQHSDTVVLTLEKGIQDFGALIEKVETTLDPIVASFRKKLAPGQRYYDIFLDAGSWEEVFLKRVDFPPLDDPDFRKFGPFVALRELEYAWSLGQLERKPGAKTLDVGSYLTWVPRFLSESGLDVISLDIDPEAIAYQKKQSAESKRPFQVLHADSTKVPLPDGSLDQILAISTVEHFDGEGDKVAMREFHRLLRPGGLVILTMPYDHYWEHLDTGLRPSPGLQRYYTMEAAVSRLVQPPLYEIVAIEFIGGNMIQIGQFQPLYKNPTNAHLICLSLRKPFS